MPLAGCLRLLISTLSATWCAAILASTVGKGFLTITNDGSDLTNANAIEVYDGSSSTPRFSISGAGAVLKAFGTFDIPHPLKNDPQQRLRHSFVESPLVDNIYTGSVSVVKGEIALFDLDVTFKLTPGTFEALNFNPRVMVVCNGCIAAWSFTGAHLSLWCGNLCGTAPAHDFSYQVVAERHDAQILKSGFVGADKHLVPEYTRSPQASA
jgi:hypothetical protein